MQVLPILPSPGWGSVQLPVNVCYFPAVLALFPQKALVEQWMSWALRAGLKGARANGSVPALGWDGSGCPPRAHDRLFLLGNTVSFTFSLFFL